MNVLYILIFYPHFNDLFSILGFNLAPPVVGRKVDLNDLLRVTSPALKKTYFKNGMYPCMYLPKV